MEYRRLGAAGIKVSELSYGSWVTFHKQIDLDRVVQCMRTAYEAGVNFFDNAEAYASGESERLMGEALQKLGWRRGSYLVSTKFFWGMHTGPNEKNTLNRKYLLEAIDGSLRRLQLEYVDFVFCHRPDPDTPVEETVWAMHDLISRGRALYWGTSEWGAKEIEAAFEVAERYSLRKPSMEQPEYNMLARQRVEQEYLPLFEKRNIGTTTWSPLASGLLTGKYQKGFPTNSRLSLKGMEWLKDRLSTPQHGAVIKDLSAIAESLDCSLAQLAIAWCLKNPRVSTVITGATSIEQLRENLGAAAITPRITSSVMNNILSVLQRHEF